MTETIFCPTFCSQICFKYAKNKMIVSYGVFNLAYVYFYANLTKETLLIFYNLINKNYGR